MPMRGSPVAHPPFPHRSHIPLAVSSQRLKSRTSSSADHPHDRINNTRRVLTSRQQLTRFLLHACPSESDADNACPRQARLVETGVAPLPEAAEAPEREPPPAAPDAVAVGHDVCAEVAAADVL